MGKEHLIVARGWDGLDEISVSAPTRILEYRNGQRYDYEVNPEDFGIATLPFSAVSAPNGDACTDIAKSMLNGTPTTAHYQLVAVNAAFIYSKFIENIPLNEAYTKMTDLIFSGVMGDVLNQYIALMKGAVAAPVESGG